VPAPALSRPAPRQGADRHPYPAVDGGRYPAKRCVGRRSSRSPLDILRDGHEVMRAVVRYRAGEPDWREAPLAHVDAHVAGEPLQAGSRSTPVGD